MIVHLNESGEVPGVDLCDDLVIELFHFMCCEPHRICSGDQREELVLLGDIIQNLGLWGTTIDNQIAYVAAINLSYK